MRAREPLAVEEHDSFAIGAVAVRGNSAQHEAHHSHHTHECLEHRETLVQLGANEWSVPQRYMGLLDGPADSARY